MRMCESINFFYFFCVFVLINSVVFGWLGKTPELAFQVEELCVVGLDTQAGRQSVFVKGGYRVIGVFTRFRGVSWKMQLSRKPVVMAFVEE